MSIGSRTHEEFMEEARAFHGYPAPGLIIGGYMVELAKRHMPEGVLYDAVSETAHCLPDAVQLLTPCTFGNGWLRVLPFGIYAVTLYDKATGEGVRVELDNDKLEPYDAIRSWFLKERPKKEQDTERLQAQIKEAGESILSFRKVRIRQDMLGHRSFGAITRCPLCGSHYPASYGGVRRSRPARRVLPPSAPPTPPPPTAGSAAPARDSPRMRTAPASPCRSSPVCPLPSRSRSRRRSASTPCTT